MADFLSEMAARSSERAVAARLGGFESIAADQPPPRPLVLSEQGFDLIAEAKLRGPADGRLLPDGDDTASVVAQASAFATGGASVISILTEPDRFDGTLEHLSAVAAATDTPVMRKDFLVDPVQVYEARAHGASGILLIARILSPNLLVELAELAASLGMFSLVEVFDVDDIELASVLFEHDVLVGVNSRDLTDLSVDRTRFASLAPLLPPRLPKVAESGIETPEDVAGIVGLGYQMALVGTSLSRSTDVSAAVAALVSSGRSAVVSR